MNLVFTSWCAWMARYRIAEAESKLSNRSRQAGCRHSPGKKNPASAGFFPLSRYSFQVGLFRRHHASNPRAEPNNHAVAGSGMIAGPSVIREKPKFDVAPPGSGP
jgi:hypothetical protein